jgi:stress response protein YsnF
MSDYKRPSERGPTLPLLEEHATIDKRTVTTGKVRVVTHTETVEETFALFSRERKRRLSRSNWIRR